MFMVLLHDVVYNKNDCSIHSKSFNADIYHYLHYTVNEGLQLRYFKGDHWLRFELIITEMSETVAKLVESVDANTKLGMRYDDEAKGIRY